jgi:hypothetical protein
MDWIVFGLGKSVKLLSRTEAILNYNTIGVNDIDQYHTVNHLVIPDKWEAFIEPRLKIIGATQADTVWLKEQRTFPGLERHPDIRYYKVYCWDHEKETNLDTERIPYHFTSPFLACALAWKYLRAKRIGLLGVDLLSDHHMSSNQVLVNRGFGELRQALLQRGTELVNLSPIANLPALPLIPLSHMRMKTCES